MKHTTVRQPPEDELPPELSKGYNMTGRFVEQGFEYVPPAPAGSMSASAGDMVQFMIAHLADGKNGDARILQRRHGPADARPALHPDPRLEGMAYGFMRQNYGDELIVEHGGDTFAFHSYFVMLPEAKPDFSFRTTRPPAGLAQHPAQVPAGSLLSRRRTSRPPQARGRFCQPSEPLPRPVCARSDIRMQISPARHTVRRCRMSRRRR